ncbi:UDP-N-acetylglucosamine--LPS N-acetylglucosamine transferase [Paenibacillus sp. CAA11]|uniref:MGDG synthase family glycosyltransferase n=1 Tax=Paenibacillus sp. CAA11 TaxID=1532905 RepID=UPI000D349CBC|nr:glycosyltransferase [Paenibacillus sp. CAA11]AWB43609.1 UDP-N-acetylglucosamine--LPS N-acetylglucosamine transferase [Paenibacillus sp. CAA11]
MHKKRVLILSEGFGSGHTQAAHGLAAGLKKLLPGIQTKVMELGTFLNPSIGPLILSAYRKTVCTSPSLVGMFYRSNYKKRINRFTRLALHKVFYSHALQVIRQLKPDLIICTHPIPSAVISRLKADGLEVPLCTLITDYDAHGAWISQEVDRFLVSTPAVKELLQEGGIRSDRIRVTGIPVHPKFWEACDKRTVREELGLKDMPTVLVMGGGWGLMFNEHMLARLTAWRERVQILFCTGSNTKLAAKLRSHPSFDHPHIRVLGHTREVDKLMDASDLLVTKPGGMTCTEGLAKGLPMLFCQSIPGQEERNCEYFVQQGYGAVLETETCIDRWFVRLTSQSPLLSTLGSLSAGKVNKQQPAAYHPESCSQAVAEMLYGSLSVMNPKLEHYTAVGK